jgi:arginase
VTYYAASPLAVLDAPSNLGLMPPAPGRQPGVCFSPDALRSRNLLHRIGAGDGGRVSPPPYSYDIDTGTGVRNGPAIATYSRQLADAVASLLESGRLPIILGGDCSILLGSGLALKRRGTYGLVFIDGHQDLLTPATSSTNGAAGMDLALACGVGPRSLTVFDGLTAFRTRTSAGARRPERRRRIFR